MKNTIQLILVIIVAARAIVRVFHLDVPGMKWLNIAGGVAFMVLLIMWTLDYRNKNLQKKQQSSEVD